MTEINKSEEGVRHDIHPHAFIRHTPGPWTFIDNDCPQRTDYWRIEAASGHYVCVFDGMIPEAIPATRANAHLIAAAPRMLFALENLLRAYTAAGTDTSDGWWAEARAAVAEARGEAVMTTPKVVTTEDVLREAGAKEATASYIDPRPIKPAAHADASCVGQEVSAYATWEEGFTGVVFAIYQTATPLDLSRPDVRELLNEVLRLREIVERLQNPPNAHG
jgi:hypothetical protein